MPKPPTNMTLSDSESSDEDIGQANKNMDCDPTFAGACSSNEPHLLTQGGLNDIVRDLKLSKKQAENLGSRLKVIFCARTLRCVFAVGSMKNSRISSPRKMASCFAMMFFSVMEVLGREYNPDQWRLFTDSSKVSLRLVLLHNGNRFPTVPLAHADNMKEGHESMKLLFGKIKYDELNGNYVAISRLWHCYSECNPGTQNTAVSHVSVTTGTRRVTI